MPVDSHAADLSWLYEHTTSGKSVTIDAREAACVLLQLTFRGEWCVGFFVLLHTVCAAYT